MIRLHKYAAVLLATLATATAAASQQVSAPVGWSINHTVIVLDPAHGGTDVGATLGDHLFEKDITLAIASRLRAALAAQGFNVVATRDGDPADPLTTDQRAEAANRTHAAACIVIHATATGSGVHIYTSNLPPNEDADPTVGFVPVPWNTAQAEFVRQSADLAGDLSSALGNAHLPSIVGHAPVRPLDNLMCPAVAIELAPLLAPGVGSTPATDANYQQQVANALATALQVWRSSPDLSPTADASPEGQIAAQAKAIAAAEAAGRAATKVRTTAASPAAQKGPQ